jgi:hypothetical protein
VSFVSSSSLAVWGGYVGFLRGPSGICTPESPDLLFTLSSVFAEMSVTTDADLAYCETLYLMTPLIGTATVCGVATETAQGPTSTPSTSGPGDPSRPPGDGEDPPVPPPASNPATPSPSDTAAAPPGTDEGGSQSGDSGGGTSGGSTTGPVGDDNPQSSESASAQGQHPIRDPGATAQPLDVPDESAVVKTVGNDRFPVRIMAMVAMGLAAFGVSVLAVPAIRQRRHAARQGL